MDSKFWIEAVGYTGSALVLVSFLMVSVFKLRVVNSIGSIIFTVYAFIIKSYPTAIMNLCLVGINIYYLIKMSNTSQDSKIYDLVKVSSDDSMFKHLIEIFGSDIKKCFPGISLDFATDCEAYVICSKGTASGIFVGKRRAGEDGVMDILLDYSMPDYRDFSIGAYLFSQLPGEGIKSLYYNGPDEHHLEYLKKYDFTKTADGYVKVF